MTLSSPSTPCVTEYWLAAAAHPLCRWNEGGKGRAAWSDSGTQGPPAWALPHSRPGVRLCPRSPDAVADITPRGRRSVDPFYRSEPRPTQVVLVVKVERVDPGTRSPASGGSLGWRTWLVIPASPRTHHPALHPEAYPEGSLPGPKFGHPRRHSSVTRTWHHSSEATERRSEPEPLGPP